MTVSSYEQTKEAPVVCVVSRLFLHLFVAPVCPPSLPFHFHFHSNSISNSCIYSVGYFVTLKKKKNPHVLFATEMVFFKCSSPDLHSNESAFLKVFNHPYLRPQRRHISLVPVTLWTAS